MAMHFGLLVLLVAGVVSSMTRFSGIIVLAEGQRVTDEAASYYDISRSPRYGAAFTGAQFGLESMEFVYDGDTIVDAVALMRRAGASEVYRARVNYPFRAAGKSYLLNESGLAAGIRVQQGGQTLIDGIVNLGTRVPEGYTDRITLSDGRVLTLTAVGDRQVQSGSSAHQLYLLKDPAVRVTPQGSASYAELGVGETASLGDLTLTATDVRLWTSFNVRADKGLPIAYVGFALALLGMLARWLDPEVRLTVELSDDRRSARVWHSTRYGLPRAIRASSHVERLLSGDED